MAAVFIVNQVVANIVNNVILPVKLTGPGSLLTGGSPEKTSSNLISSKGEQGTAELGAKTVLKQTNELCF